MEKPLYNYAFIFGSHPELSLFELKSVLRATGVTTTKVVLRSSIVLIETTEPLDAQKLMARLGGTIKIVEMVGEYNEDALSDWLFEQVDRSTKFHFGFSLYALEGNTRRNDVRTLHHLGLALKKALKADEISCRFVAANEVALSSVIVHKERLLKNGVDIVLLRDGNTLQFGKTLAVQPFQEFSQRDYGRPGYDSKSGMLPPKVARMMLNIAQPQHDDVILDPFCGSGTVLIEAFAMGCSNIIGADISDKAVRDTMKNISWMKIPSVAVHLADVKTIDTVIGANAVDCIVAEGDLGRPRPDHPDMERKDAMRLYPKAIAAMARTLKPGGRMVFAFPAWRAAKNQLLTLPLEADIQNNGLTSFHKPLVYGRPNARVVRHIYFLQKKG